MAAWSCSAPAKASRPRAKPSGGRPTNTTCRGSRSSTRWTAKGPISRRVFDEIGKRLGAQSGGAANSRRPGPPHVREPFRGVIDLVEMKMLTFPDGKDGNKIIAAEIPRGPAGEAAAVARADARIALRLQQRADGAGAGRGADSRSAHSQGASRGDAASCRFSRCCAVRRCTASACSRFSTRWPRYLPNPTDVPPVEGVDLTQAKGKASAERPLKRKISAQARSGTSRFAGWCSRFSRTRRATCHWVRDLFGRARSQLPRAAIPARTRRKTSPQLWRIHAIKKEEQLDVGAGRRHRRRHRPAAIRSPATRSATPASRSCSNRSSFPRRSSRWRSSRRAPTTARSWPKRSTMLRKQDPTFRAEENPGNRPDADQRHGRAAPGSDSSIGCCAISI